MRPVVFSVLVIVTYCVSRPTTGPAGGVRMHHKSCKELFDDEEHGGPLIPILALAHEHDPDPEMRPHKDNSDVELQEKLILYCWSSDGDLPLFCAIAAKNGSRSSDPCPPRFGQEIQALLRD